MRGSRTDIATTRGVARATVLALACAAGAALACGDDTAEALAEARERVDRMEAQVEAARRTVERKEADVEAAQQELARAGEQLAAAEERLAEARAQVAEVADDAWVFRAVQGTLLEDPQLEGLAISARVEDGVVTLEGRVPKEAQREHAEELTAQTAGVVRVDNRIRVGEAKGGEKSGA